MHKTKAAGISRMGTRRPHNAAKYAQLQPHRRQPRPPPRRHRGRARRRLRDHVLACCLSRDLSFRLEMERRVGNGREWCEDGKRREDGEREGGSSVNREGGERRERRESARVGNGR